MKEIRGGSKTIELAMKRWEEEYRALLALEEELRGAYEKLIDGVESVSEQGESPIRPRKAGTKRQIV